MRQECRFRFFSARSPAIGSAEARICEVSAEVAISLLASERSRGFLRYRGIHVFAEGGPTAVGSSKHNRGPTIHYTLTQIARGFLWQGCTSAVESATYLSAFWASDLIVRRSRFGLGAEALVSLPALQWGGRVFGSAGGSLPAFFGEETVVVSLVPPCSWRFKKCSGIHALDGASCNQRCRIQQT